LRSRTPSAEKPRLLSQSGAVSGTEAKSALWGDDRGMAIHQNGAAWISPDAAVDGASGEPERASPLRPSSDQTRTYEQTIGYARIALEQITALRLPADPPSFSVWYTYATGGNPGLNQTINGVKMRDGTISVAEIDRVYQQYVSPTVDIEGVEAVREKIVGEVDQVVAMIDAATGSAVNYAESLSGARQNLAHTNDRQLLLSMVERLLGATKEMEQENAGLQVSLQSAKREIGELQAKLVAIHNESRTDPVTRLASRKWFDEALDLAIRRSVEGGRPLSLLMIDIDYFKKFNDAFGHVMGDQVLRLIASTMKLSIRGQDTAARYGGEEFAVILPDTALHQAVAVAENIRKNIFDKEVIQRSTRERLGRISISVGVAQLDEGDTAEAIVERADSRLYAAKTAGRNRVCGDRGAGSDILAFNRRPSFIRLIWQEAYECGEPTIDRQHRELFDLANVLFDASFNSESSPQASGAVLQELLAHIVRHFADEEAVLARHGYKELEAHQRAHAGLLARAGKLKESVAAGKSTSGDLVEFLANTVIAEHLLKADREFVSLFNKEAA
jgi:diguanylate cyclase (GGDEF)-like protein/hemerythrin-like metal-binding protein